MPIGATRADLYLRMPMMHAQCDGRTTVTDLEIVPGQRIVRPDQITLGLTVGTGSRRAGQSDGPHTGVCTTGEDREEEINVAAVAAYRTSIDTGRPLSERKLAAMFGKTSRRWARSRIAHARRLACSQPPTPVDARRRGWVLSYPAWRLTSI